MRLAPILLLGLALAGWSERADAQPRSQPSEQQRRLPGYGAPEREGVVTPSPTQPGPVPAPAAGPLVFVRELRVEGSTVFSQDELARVTAPWTGRVIDSLELRDAADAVTKLYVDHGYVSSGATVPDQEIEGGVLTLQVVESVLSDVEVEGNNWYGTAYLRRRLLAAVPAPVNLNDVDAALHLLLEERGIGHVSGELRPGLRRGETLLALKVDDSQPIGVDLIVGNTRSPEIGSVSGESLIHAASLLGLGDQLLVDLEFTDGFDQQEVDYSIPLNGYGTSLGLLFRRGDSQIVEEFQDLDIESDSISGGVALRHPLIWRPERQLWIGALGEWRHSKTTLHGQGFSFEPGADEGESTVTALRLLGEWIQRSPSDVLAARSTLSFGLDVLGATHNAGTLADGQFVSWLGQAQWAHRFRQDVISAELVTRFDIQVSDSSLLSLEQFALGGIDTVRGYRVNQVVSDNAAVGSIELRIPVLNHVIGRDELALAPFVDVGHAWDDNDTAQKTLASVGIGLRYQIGDRLGFQAYWGQRLNDTDRQGDDLQDYGLFLRVELRAL